ncbi:MAG TPA: hypothetical protein ENH11_00215 [Candidatus Acetothermia bacterium]|nr:hypothetical protein [Candidatus Acetothermia bacterium]
MQHDEPATKRDLGELKQELITKIDANAVKIDANGAKIDANGAKIEANNAKIDDVEKRLSAKIDANSAMLSRVSHQVIENREQIGQLVTMSKKFEEYFSEIISSLDGLTLGFTRLDQERIVMNAQLDRVDRDVDKNKADIKEIKIKLTMP